MSATPSSTQLTQTPTRSTDQPPPNLSNPSTTPSNPSSNPSPKPSTESDARDAEPEFPSPSLPPPHQAMRAEPAPVHPTNLGERLQNVPGVALWQTSNWSQACCQCAGCPLEQSNEYRVLALPDGVRVRHSPDDDEGWDPSWEDLHSLPVLSKVTEHSNCCVRCLATLCNCAQFRALRLDLAPDGDEDNVEYHVDRDCVCGGVVCSGEPKCLLEMRVHRGPHHDDDDDDDTEPKPFGRVRENFEPCCGRCLEACFLRGVYHDVQRRTANDNEDEWETRFQLQANLCTTCFGKYRNNNCFGATWCRHSQVFDIVSPDGTIVGHVQKSYAPASDRPESFCAALSHCCSSFWRCMCCFSNYALSFPEGATAEERVLLVVSLMQVDFEMFERTGNQYGQ